MNNINDFEIKDGKLLGYNGEDEEIIIPDGVKVICREAVSSWGVKSITIPGSVSVVEEYALYDCRNLERIFYKGDLIKYLKINFEGTPWNELDLFIDGELVKEICIPDGVTDIGCAFYRCKSLESITIPDSVTNIADNAFSSCGNLKSVYVDDLRSFLNINCGEGRYTGLWNGADLFVKGEMVKDIVVPDGMKIIGRALSGLNNVESISLPESIERIEESAFENCKNLKRITILNGVSDIGNSAFEDCESLTSIMIPDSVARIGHSCFSGCTNLNSITLPNSITYIGDYVFSRCYSLTSIAIPDGVESIGQYAFASCRGLKSITLPDSVHRIDKYAFEGCSSIKDVKLSNSLKSLGIGAFKECVSLKSVMIPDGITAIGNQTAPSYAQRHDIYIFHEDTVVILKEYMQGIEKLYVSKRLVFRETPLQEIKSLNAKRYAIHGFLSVDDISVYDDAIIDSYKKYLRGKIVNYRDFILENNTEMIVRRLASLNLLDSKLIDKMMEQDLSAEVKRILSEHNDEKTKKGKDSVSKKKGPSVTELKKIWGYKKNEEGITITSYKDVDTNIVVPETIGKDVVIEIGEHAFSAEKSGLSEKQKEARRRIKTITLPETIRHIGSFAFSGCCNLENITIPDAVTCVENYTFGGCSSLKSITIPNGVTSIGDRAFFDCKQLANIVIPVSVTSIGREAFACCSSLTDFTIPSSVTTVGRAVFAKCSNLKSVYYSGDLSNYLKIDFEETVWPKADLHINGELVTDITIPDSVTDIRAYAFSNCSSLKSVTIPHSVNIGRYAFSGCSNLETIMISDSVTKIGDCVFWGCNGLTNITIPSSVKIVENYMFAFCRNLKNATISDGVTSIEYNAFTNCSSLESVIIPDSVKKIGDNAFFNCENLTIYSPSGSVAEEYAKRQDITFHAL